MKKLVNPTKYFFAQADQLAEDPSSQIELFVKKLICKDKCELCKKPYDTLIVIPRILVHCGHTFCSPCLQKFFMNKRVRCPMCLKLVKHLNCLERLPINHTIFTHLVKQQNALSQKQGKLPSISQPDFYLYSEFERVQKEAHLQENPQKYDSETGMPFCVFHKERVQHFFCKVHQSSGCRVCIETGHSKPDCAIIDLYEEEDPTLFENEFQNIIKSADISDPLIPVDNGSNSLHHEFMNGLGDKYKPIRKQNFVLPGDSDIQAEFIQEQKQQKDEQRNSF